MADKMANISGGALQHAFSPLKKVLIVWDGDAQDVHGGLGQILDAHGLSQAQVAEFLSGARNDGKRVAPSGVSRWLNPKGLSRLPVWVLDKIAAMLNRSVLLALVDAENDTGVAAEEQALRLVREFFIGLGFLNPYEGPEAVARHIKSVWNAKSLSLYRENPSKNILEWFGGEGLENRELMLGPSLGSRLPTRVVQAQESRLQKSPPVATASSSTFSTLTLQTAGDKSAFAERERVKFWIALAIHGQHLRTTVLFLNFDEALAHDDPRLDERALAIVANELHGAVSRAWIRRNTNTEKAPRSAAAACLTVADLLDEALHNCPAHQIAPPLQAKLKEVAEGLWPEEDLSCRVCPVERSLRCFEHRHEALRFRRSDRDPPEDEMVRRSAAYGESFYIANLNEHRVRARFDRRNDIDAGQVQKLVVPVVCEAFQDASLKLKRANWREEASGHCVYQSDALSKSCVESWGAISIESREKLFAPARVLELSVIAQLVACGLYLRRRAAAARKGETGLFEAVSDVLDEIVGNIRSRGGTSTGGARYGRGAGVESANDGAVVSGGLLDPLCRQVVLKDMVGPARRCEVFRYDHERQQFSAEGGYMDREWAEDLRKWYGEGFLEQVLVGMLPRRGGNSERLLGVIDEFHIIKDADHHPRVSPVTKILRAKSLVGCSCKIGCSFRGEGVLWLGYRSSVPESLLVSDGGLAAQRLRVIAHIAGMFCMLFRWWGRDGAGAGIQGTRGAEDRRHASGGPRPE